MQRSSVKSSFLEKVREARRILVREGFGSFFRAAKRYLFYHLKAKREFVYFEFCLRQALISFDIGGAVTVKVACVEDIDRIERELFSTLRDDLSYDKKYFSLVGRPDVKCFLAEVGGRPVHYSWVFLNALESPLTDVPFDKSKLHEGDAYIGPVFTHPDYRGFIYLKVLSEILCYLKNNTVSERAILLVHGRTPSAVSFYKRLGFKEIGHNQPAGIFRFLHQRFGGVKYRNYSKQRRLQP